VAVGQKSKGTTAGATTVSTTGVNTSASGSVLVALVGVGNAATFTSIADTINGAASGNTWNQIGAEVAVNAFGYARAYYVQNANGGTNHVVTVTVSASVSMSLLLVELTGVQTSSVLDGSSFVLDSSSPFTSGGVSTTYDVDALVGGLIGGSGSNPATHAISGAAPSSGWTIQTAAEELDGTQFWAGALATVDVSSTGTYNSGFTESGASEAVVLLAAFKLAAGPMINTQPSDAAAYNNDTANFSVSATTSGGSLTYQWQVSTDRCATYSNVSGGSGGTTSSYTTASLAFSDHETFYRCAVTDSNGTTNTRGAALRINPRATGAWVKAA
jgi:hypothetical protein